MIIRGASPDEISETFGDIVTTICSMALAYYYIGKLNDAIKLLNVSQAFIENFTEEEIDLNTRFQLASRLSEILCASIFYQNVHLDKVLPTLLLTRQLAEAAYDGTTDKQTISDTLEYLGLAYYYHKLNTGEGDSSTSLAFFQQALELRRSQPHRLGESESLFHIGLVYENGDQPDSDKALLYYNRAYHNADENYDELALSYAARHLGSIAETQGNYEQARRYFQESLALREKYGFQISFPFSHLALGDLSFTQKEWNTASMHYQQAVSVSREMDVPIALIASLLSLGDLYQTQNEPATALTCFEEALALAKTLGAARWISQAASRLA